jgi:hypothetical protein
VALETIQQPEVAEIERIGGADLVIGILDPEHRSNAGAALGMVRDALGRLSNSVRTVVVCEKGTVDAGATGPQPTDDQNPAIVWFSVSEPAPAGAGPQNLSEAYQTVLTIGGKLGARACGVIGSEPRTMTSESVAYLLVHPLLEMGFDLVMPRYSRQKHEGLLNRSILAPLSWALYGARLQNPMGPDFGISGKLLQSILAQNMGTSLSSRAHPAASVVSTAVRGGLQICESYIGMRVQPATDWKDLSTLLAQILDPVFTDLERNASFWQHVRGARHVPRFGTPEPDSVEAGVVDMQRMIEAFQLGTQNLQEVWGAVLPPRTLLELRRLARVPPAQFRIPDDLWACIVYDFALGHRLRTINRDHLLRSMTPLYLGWIASYENELESAAPAEVESCLERLSAAFESKKPYLLSRWRWPDRFNP